MSWQRRVACLVFLALPAVAKELSDGVIREDIVQELPQAQEPQDLNYDDYNPFGEDDNGI